MLVRLESLGKNNNLMFSITSLLCSAVHHRQCCLLALWPLVNKIGIITGLRSKYEVLGGQTTRKEQIYQQIRMRKALEMSGLVVS